MTAAATIAATSAGARQDALQVLGPNRRQLLVRVEAQLRVSDGRH